MFKVGDVVVLKDSRENREHKNLCPYLGKCLVVTSSDSSYIKLEGVIGAGWYHRRFEYYKPKNLFEGVDFCV